MKRIGMLLVVTGIAGAAAAHDERPPRGCSAIQVTAPGLERQPRGMLFSTKKILDLHFETRFERAVYGAHVHGKAGDLAKKRVGEISLTAGDLLDHLPAAFKAR